MIARRERKELTEGCSPLTFCNCLFCGPAVGVRGSALPALLAPPPGAAVAPAPPLAGPPLPLAGDLLAGLPVVLKNRCRICRVMFFSFLSSSFRSPSMKTRSFVFLTPVLVPKEATLRTARTPKTELTREMLRYSVLNYVSSFHCFLNSNYYRRKPGVVLSN